MLKNSCENFNLKYLSDQEIEKQTLLAANF